MIGFRHAIHGATIQATVTVQGIPELRIVEQEVWDRVQERLRVSAEKAKGRNPRQAARKKYLLSGLLECACCGQPYIMISTSSGGLYGCRGRRNGTCDNAQTIRRTRIEERVFTALTPALLSPEMEVAYQAAAAAERTKAKPQDAETELKALRKAIKREEKARAAIFKAIEDGARYASFKARAEKIEASLTALQERYAAAEFDQRAASQTPPNISRSLAEALTVMHELLSDPDLVHEAHTLLATLINRIRLTPDDLAPHGIAAEIHTDLGRLLLAGGQTHQTAPILATASLLTVKHGPMPGHGTGPRKKNGPALAGHGAKAVRDAITKSIQTLPTHLCKSLTWDQGAEMAQHEQSKEHTGIQVFFCDPKSPWQRGSNENTNGLLRQYFPKGTDLSIHDESTLDAVAYTLNNRPRKTLGWRTPAEALEKVIF